jgi:hypothetical protein
MNNSSIKVCPNCKAENSYFNVNCSDCNFFLRDKIPNIDLGEIILLLIESPKIAFERIIYSKNKNYVLILLTLLSFRFLILSRFLSVPYLNQNSDFDLLNTAFYFFISSGLVISILIYLNFFFIRKLGIHTRIKDVFSVFIYSFFPSIIALLLLYPIELTVFGKYLFSNNPYPYDIKANVFYVLAGFELLLIIWSFFMQIKGMLALKLNLIISILISVFNYLILSAYLFISKKVFI